MEFRRGADGVRLAGASGLWRPAPVEYKRGRLRREAGYLVQLCAQAICLEEMLSTAVESGSIFFGKTQRRLEVRFDAALRRTTEGAAAGLHELIRSQKTPRAVYGPKCDRCSLFDACLPKALLGWQSVERYLAAEIGEPEGGKR